MEKEEVLKFWNLIDAKLIPPHGWCGVKNMFFTCRLYVGLGDELYWGHYCYHTEEAALHSLHNWNGIGRPPGLWIKSLNSEEGEVRNPVWIKLTNWIET